MFSGFHPYDDEGYFLLTLKHYVAGRPLFTEALPIYGPFYYEVVGAVFKVLGLAPSHDAGRWLTVGVWIAASLIGGLAAYRLSRSVLLGLAAQLVTFKALDALANEPTQPAGLTSLLLLSLVFVSTYWRTKPRYAALAIGALVGAMFMVKVNVGVFAAMAVAFAWAASLAPRYRRWLWPLIALLVTLAPFALTARLLGQAWVLEFAVLVALAAAAVAVAAVAVPPPMTPPPSTVWLLAGGVGVVVISAGIALAGGTRAADMWNGLVVLPIRFPGVFAAPLTISPVADLWALLSLGAAIAASRRSRLGWLSPGGAGFARILAGLGTLVAILLLPSSTYIFGVPLAWLAARSPLPNADDPAAGASRLLVPMLAVTAALQAYPVPGTQVSLGALPLVAAATMTLGDGVRQYRAAAGRTRVSVVAAPVALVVNAAAVLLLAFTVLTDFGAATQLALPGAQSVRLVPEQGAQLRGVVVAIKANCTSFITIPGMDSMYLWTDQDPPAELSSEVWWLVLDKDQQQAIVDRLRGRQGLCVVKNQQYIDFWAQGRPVPDRPLVEFINHEFVPMGAWGDYQLLVRRAAPS